MLKLIFIIIRVIAERPLAPAHKEYIHFNSITETFICTSSSNDLINVDFLRKRITEPSMHITINPRYAASVFATIIPQIIRLQHKEKLIFIIKCSALQYPITAIGKISTMYCPNTEVFPSVERKLYSRSVFDAIRENKPNKSAPINWITANSDTKAPPKDAISVKTSSTAACLDATQNPNAQIITVKKPRYESVPPEKATGRYFANTYDTNELKMNANPNLSVTVSAFLKFFSLVLGRPPYSSTFFS